jgi:CRISPR-associated protein Csm4
MGEYRAYTVGVKLVSSVGSEFQSDTIFGQFCWALRFLEGEAVLKDFLSSYEKEKAPPLLISNGFPKGYVAKPMLIPVSQQQLGRILGESNRLEASSKIKTIKRMSIMPKALLKELQKEVITPRNLFEAMYRSYGTMVTEEHGRRASVVQHNTIDRARGSVRDGGLYASDEVFFHPEAGHFEIYLKTTYFSRDDLVRVFRYMGNEGFGRDASTGKGHFRCEVEDGIELPEPEQPNAFMTLSAYVPAEDDPVRGYYGVLHKYGKLGGLYAKGGAEVFRNPFKVPLIMFSAGSTFFDADYGRAKVYGRLLDHVHANKDIRHYAYAFPIGMNIEDTHEDV